MSLVPIRPKLAILSQYAEPADDSNDNVDVILSICCSSQPCHAAAGDSQKTFPKSVSQFLAATRAFLLNYTQGHGQKMSVPE